MKGDLEEVGGHVEGMLTSTVGMNTRFAWPCSGYQDDFGLAGPCMTTDSNRVERKVYRRRVFHRMKKASPLDLGPRILLKLQSEELKH